MSTALTTIDDAALPVGARRLGVRVKPILRLGLGRQGTSPNEPAIIKTDYFTVRGDDRAVAKFVEEYGDKPKAVEILLPAELDVALTIQYRAFKGARGGEGGTMVAVGSTNFAHRDYCGGADLLTVFNQDGSVEEVETLGLDGNTREPLDDVARQLGLGLYTTFRAGMPGVLGFGSFFDVTSKGKESTDNLWAKLRELYGLFGSRVSFAMKPQLVLRQSKARPVIVKDGVSKRTTTTIWVLDIVVPETIDEMMDRLAARNRELLPGGMSAASVLYGAPVAELETGSPVEAPSSPAEESEAASPSLPASGSDPDEDVVDAEFEPIDEEPVVEPEQTSFVPPAAVQAEQAAAFVVPNGQNKGLTIAQVAAKGEQGVKWIRWAAARYEDSPEFKTALTTYVQAFLAGGS